MAGTRQPISVVQSKGKKHLTKAEIKERENSEVQAPDDNIISPSFLSAKQKKDFHKIADELKKLNIMSNLDCDALGTYIVARDQYIKTTKEIKKIEKKYNVLSTEKLVTIQSKYYKQMHSSANDLGLTISSRCKLVVPKVEETKVNKFDKFRSGGSNA